MTEIAIRVKGLHYRYADGTVGVENADLEVQRGESVAVVGPNGSGKSTLLMLIGMLLQPSAGSVTIFGEELTQEKARRTRRRMGILFQNPDDMLFSNTLKEDLEFGPAQLGVPKEKAEMIVKEVAAKLGLEELLDKPPFRLSQGEKQRGAIGCVLTLQPEILLLDEPTSQIDSSSKKVILALLNDFRREGGTLLITTHDLNVVPYVSSRVYVMGRQKRIVAEGGVRDVLTNYDLLRQNGVDMPQVAELFMQLRSDDIPLTIEEAAGLLSRSGRTVFLKSTDRFR